MVPSERSTTISHRTESTPQENGLTGRVEGTALEKLKNLFVNEAEVDLPTSEALEVTTNLGGAALAETASFETSTTDSLNEEVSTRLARTHTAQHADEHHHGTQAAQRFDKKEAAELWGVNDSIAPEDVPEGEMTWEQYIAQRPKAEAGDVAHSTDKNGRTIIYDATTGYRVSKKESEARSTYAPRDGAYYDAVNEKRIVSDAHDDALVENEKHDQEVSDILRARTEGEIFVEKDERLKQLSVLGSDLLSLRDSMSKKDYESEGKQLLEAKAAAFKALLTLYGSEDVNSTGLQYIKETYLEPYESATSVVYKGAAYLDGEKVTVKDVIVSSAGDTSYVLEDAGETDKTVDADAVEFQREYDIPEKKKPGLFERLKKGISKQARALRQFGLDVYLSPKWNNPADWLFNHNTEGLEGEELQKQKEKNRRSRLLGGAAVLAGTAVAVWAGFQINEHLTPDVAATLAPDMPSGSAGGEASDWVTGRSAQSLFTGEHPAPGGFHAPLETGSDAPVTPGGLWSEADQQLAQAIENPIYNVPSGGSLSSVFEGLKINPDKIWNHADELLKFKDFYREGEDIKILNPGWLSPEARTYIEGLKG